MKTVSFLKNIEYKADKPVASLILETDFSKEIRISFKDGQLMKDHKAPYPIVVQVLQGTINFGIQGEVVKLATGDAISLNENVIHNLAAIGDSVVRLTLSKQDSINRVKNV